MHRGRREQSEVFRWARRGRSKSGSGFESVRVRLRIAFPYRVTALFRLSLSCQWLCAGRLSRSSWMEAPRNAAAWRARRRRPRSPCYSPYYQLGSEWDLGEFFHQCIIYASRFLQSSNTYFLSFCCNVSFLCLTLSVICRCGQIYFHGKLWGRRRRFRHGRTVHLFSAFDANFLVFSA